MTKRQTAYFFQYLWPEAAAVMGWDASSRSLRLSFFKSVLGESKSFTEFSEPDFDAIKGRCLAIIESANVSAQVRQIEQPKTRKTVKIEQLIRCLGLYIAEPEAYAREIVRDQFGAEDWRDLSDAPRGSGFDPRTGRSFRKPSQLESLIRTLSGRLNGVRGLRARAGETLHQMNQRAGLRCQDNCRTCHPKPAPMPITVAHDHA